MLSLQSVHKHLHLKYTMEIRDMGVEAYMCRYLDSYYSMFRLMNTDLSQDF